MPDAPNKRDTTKALIELRGFLGERLATAAESLQKHARDVSHHLPAPPDAVALPQNVDEVAKIVAVCARHRVPVIPFGTGTAVEGGVLAVEGGVTVDVGGLNRIVRLSMPDMDVTVEAGVTRKQLNTYLAQQQCGLHFPVDPGADASLGGMAATCASGSAAVRYGTMRDNVLGLTVVLADGSLIRTGGRARKSSAGYDLTRLFVGSEGTLGVIVEVTLKLSRLPSAVSAAVCAFANIDSAVAAAIELLSAGVPLARLELLDEMQIAAVNRFSNLSYKVAPTLFFEFHGSSTGVVEQAEAAGGIARKHGGEDFQWATRPEVRNRLWQARHDAYYASLALRPGGVGYVTDVCVPISELAGTPPPVWVAEQT